MNFIWVSFLMISLGIMLFNNVDVAFSTILSGSEKAVALSIKLWSIYAVWLGLLKIVEDTGLNKKIAKALNPIIEKLFGKISGKAKNEIAINITSNLLGMGDACIPSGINSINCFDSGKITATAEMIMILILNTTSLQILPTTVIGLRIAAGSLNANSVIFPTLIATSVSTISGIILCKICEKIKKKIRRKNEF